MNQEVRRIMNTNPIVVTPQKTLKQVADTMRRHTLNQVPVISEKGKLVGLVSYEALLHAYESGSTDTLTAADIMSTQMPKIAPKDKVGTAAELFADRRFKSLPVVNLKNELKGIITAFNVVRAAFNSEYKSSILYPEVFG